MLFEVEHILWWTKNRITNNRYIMIIPPVDCTGTTHIHINVLKFTKVDACWSSSRVKHSLLLIRRRTRNALFVFIIFVIITRIFVLIIITVSSFMTWVSAIKTVFDNLVRFWSVVPKKRIFDIICKIISKNLFQNFFLGYNNF